MGVVATLPELSEWTLTDLIEQHKSDSRVSVGMGNAGWECLWRPSEVVQAQFWIILEQVI